MRTRLTAAFVQTATAEPGAERTVYWDTALPSFGLMVTAAGHRSFVCQYRARKHSRRSTISVALGLDGARREARKLLGDVARGSDPMLAKRQAAQEKKADTLESVAREYFKREGRKLRTFAKRQATFERLIFPRLGHSLVEEIRRIDIVRLLDSIEDNNGPVMATKALAFLSKLFNWHASRSEFRSPIVRGMARSNTKERARARTLSDQELGKLWRATEGASSPFAALVRFLLLTACRRMEAAGMRRDELAGADWLIPAARTKNKKEFLLPLSAEALAVLAGIPVIGNTKDGPVFTTNGRCSISGFSVWKRTLDGASGVKGWCLHDLRRTARSLLSRAGVNADIAERCLNHSIGGVRGTYDRHSFYTEKRQAFEALAQEIAAIIR
jgi:integrase